MLKNNNAILVEEFLFLLFFPQWNFDSLDGDRNVHLPFFHRFRFEFILNEDETNVRFANRRVVPLTRIRRIEATISARLAGFVTSIDPMNWNSPCEHRTTIDPFVYFGIELNSMLKGFFGVKRNFTVVTVFGHRIVVAIFRWHQQRSKRKGNRRSSLVAVGQEWRNRCRSSAPYRSKMFLKWR